MKKGTKKKMFHDFVEPRIRYSAVIPMPDIPVKFVRIITRAKNSYWYRVWCCFVYLFVMDNSMASKIGFSLVRGDDLLKSIRVVRDSIEVDGVSGDSCFVLELLRYCYRPEDKTKILIVSLVDETSPFRKNTKGTVLLKSKW